MERKLQEIKNAAFKLAQKMGMFCTQTQHFKKRGLTVGLDLRSKRGWLLLIDRIAAMETGVLVPFLRQAATAIAA
ncbi:MAG: hypothetical protein KME46_29750 [Brasilonema angustatum HA4187-MV1]|nr:hypothetical protein [Brasilonema sp. CT11]MBW4596967.1 hypothetical protein [Brasilonema angustatum HA4187-MV1]